MGPLCVTRSNPTHQLTDPIQPNLLQVEKFGPDPSQYNYQCSLQFNSDVFYTQNLGPTLQGCKRDLSLRDRDETETFGFWSETRPRPRPSCNSTRPRRDREVWFLPWDETETETLQGRDRDVFRDLQHCAKTMNGNLPLLMSQTAHSLQLHCSVHYHEIYSPHKH